MQDCIIYRAVRHGDLCGSVEQLIQNIKDNMSLPEMSTMNRMKSSELLVARVHGVFDRDASGPVVSIQSTSVFADL
jgi:hypothetical protein